jgi:hypothetical protein
MRLIDNDRISHSLAGAILGWAAGFAVLYVPIFHLLFRCSIVSIAVFTCIACGGQLAVTPWLFSARATLQNPIGNVVQRAYAVVLWFTLTALAFLYYLLHLWRNDQDARAFFELSFVTTSVFGVIGFIAVGVVSRRRR